MACFVMDYLMFDWPEEALTQRLCDQNMNETIANL